MESEKIRQTSENDKKQTHRQRTSWWLPVEGKIGVGKRKAQTIGCEVGYEDDLYNTGNVDVYNWKGGSL